MIGNAGSSFRQRGLSRMETSYSRWRWRQVSQDPNAPPEKITMTIKQPQIAKVYYTTCGAIDRHIWYRQDDLRIEKKIQMKDWSVRVNPSIFAMIVVDTWLIYNTFKNAPPGNQKKCLQKEFYSILAEELIDNSYDSRGQGTRWPRSSPNGTSYQEACIRAVENGCTRAGVLTHLTPVKRLKYSNGEKTSFRYQGRCKECQKKTTWQCSDCNDNEKRYSFAQQKMENGAFWTTLLVTMHTLMTFKHSVNVSFIFHLCKHHRIDRHGQLHFWVGLSILSTHSRKKWMGLIKAFDGVD